MARKVYKDINKMTKTELETFIFNQARYVNQQLTLIENESLTTVSRAYEYVQTNLRNLSYMNTTADSVRFRSKKNELKRMTFNDLKKEAFALQKYKNTKTGTIWKINDVLRESARTFTETLQKETGAKTILDKDDMKRLFANSDWDKNRYSSERLLQIINQFGLDTAEYWVRNVNKSQSIIAQYRELKNYSRRHEL